VLGHGAAHGARQRLAGTAVRNAADVEREHLTAGALDARDEIVLHPQRPHEAIEVGGDDDVGAARFHRLDLPSGARRDRSAASARDVELVDRLQQLKPVSLTPASRTRSPSWSGRSNSGALARFRASAHPGTRGRQARR
jgi:hypothetical protein